MGKLEQELTKLRDKYQRQYNLRKQLNDDLQMWSLEGSIDACNEILRDVNRKKALIEASLNGLEWEARERGKEQTRVRNICYDGGRYNAVPHIRELVEKYAYETDEEAEEMNK